MLFVRSNADDTQATAGKHDWAVFLTTNMTLSPAEILELYSLRWAIGLDFLAIKTYMGMEMLRYKTPEMAQKEIAVHLLAST